ncbi:hypothetical protein F441_08819 [Phytophthora nicotianae CJ01A1]|uniref:Uncharacterized protein n=5 Tax=Phytophthora nicotianae TaxID=4792 RepID=V9F8S6_PHYNI|nr:hypothetical protein F443_08843 [Phytophthora nicotianae P1569]ETK87418.1 hypothetical protein L915_08148 [Phytophthora nicotianae]ETO75524.1 hypothetical protein F444_08909 [Phytophthora nicotianae P1976]ETP16615.1 hypothetical protein F441_08819 [Phytophthora nicotianae CJ01A1]ETP44664.1 hypothetical protein F442_08783 [Phytophthora nicotianae P10297]
MKKQHPDVKCKHCSKEIRHAQPKRKSPTTHSSVP